MDIEIWIIESRFSILQLQIADAREHIVSINVDWMLNTHLILHSTCAYLSQVKRKIYRDGVTPVDGFFRLFSTLNGN